MRIQSYLQIICLLLLISSCSPILSLYGVRNPKEISEKKIIRYSKRLNIPKDAIYKLDTSYFSFLSSLKLKINDSLIADTLIKIELKHVQNHFQPLQALYFNNKGILESFQINCYAGGFPNLIWDRDSILTTFPPKIQAPLDSLLSDSLLISFSKPIFNSTEFKIGDFDFTVYVLYSKFTGRQNKRFIHFIQENLQLSNEKKVRVIYINMDNAYAISGIW
jgi:hypothetical protein